MKPHAYDFDQALARGLFDLKGRINGGDPHFIEPFEAAFLDAYSPENRFYRQPKNAHRHFVLRSGGEVVGGVTAMVNGVLEQEGKPVGLVGLYECVDDDAASMALLGSAVDWLRARGIDRIWGPMDFDIWHGYRFMTRGFETSPFFGEPRNPKHYPGQLARFGFVPKKRWASQETDTTNLLNERHAGRFAKLEAEGYRISTVDPKRAAERERLHGVLDAAYSGFLGRTSLSLAEFEGIFGRYLKLCDPRFVFLAHDPKGSVAGFSVSYPDIADAVRAMRGRTGLASRFRFMLERHKADRIVSYLIGVTPQEATARRGLGSALAHETLRAYLDAGFERTMIAMVAEDSVARKFTGHLLDDPEREYVLYELKP